MKYLKTYEEITGVEYVPSEREHSSYKNEEKKRRRKKKGESDINLIAVPPNKIKDVISFKGKP